MIQNALAQTKKAPQQPWMAYANQPATPAASTPQTQMAAFNNANPYKDGLKWRDMTKQMGYAGQQSVLGGLNWYNQNQPQHLNLLSQALASLNPANRMGRVADYRRTAMGQSLDQANQHAGMLPQYLQEALRIGAMNDATQAGNEFMMQQYAPGMDAQNAMASAQLMSPQVSNPLLDWYTGLTMGGDQANPKSSGGLGNTIMGLAGAAGQLGIF